MAQPPPWIREVGGIDRGRVVKRLIRTVLLAGLLLASVAQADPAHVYLSPRSRLQFVAGRGADAIAEQLARTAEDDRDWANRDVGQDYQGQTTVRVAVDPVSFLALQPPNAPAPPWASGVAYPELNLIVLKVGVHETNPRALLRHELSHIAVGQLTDGRAPRWLLEGLAVVHAGDEWNSEGPSLIKAALADNLYSFDRLARGFPERASEAELAYAQSAHFVKYLIDRFGEDHLQQVIIEMVHGATFDAAVDKVLQATPAQLENAWRRTISRWEMLFRVVSNHEFHWGLATLLCLYAGWKVRRRRHARLVALEHEEQAEAMRVLIRSPATWADGPTNPEPRGDEAEVEDSDDLSALDEDDEIPDAYPALEESAPKKPTLH
jgi:hypothetical protein